MRCRPASTSRACAPRRPRRRGSASSTRSTRGCSERAVRAGQRRSRSHAWPGVARSTIYLDLRLRAGLFDALAAELFRTRRVRARRARRSRSRRARAPAWRHPRRRGDVRRPPRRLPCAALDGAAATAAPSAAPSQRLEEARAKGMVAPRAERLAEQDLLRDRRHGRGGRTRDLAGHAASTPSTCSTAAAGLSVDETVDLLTTTAERALYR